jgi:hypothetical protein
MGHYFVLRGENRRGAELPNLAGRILPTDEGPTEAYMCTLCCANGKTNKFGKKQYGGAIRNKCIYTCTQSALAQYFFWRWQQSTEAPPDLSSHSAYYNTKVLCGSNEQKPISFRQQYDDIRQIFQEEVVNCFVVTHAPRHAAVTSAEFHGVPSPEVSRSLPAASPNTYTVARLLERAIGTTLPSPVHTGLRSSFPMKFLRRMASTTCDPGSYYVARAHVKVPGSLLAMVWPWLRPWQVRFRARSQRKKWAQGGLDKPDHAGQGFVNLLTHLRQVLLQDLAVLQPGQFGHLLGLRICLDISRILGPVNSALTSL